MRPNCGAALPRVGSRATTSDSASDSASDSIRIGEGPMDSHAPPASAAPGGLDRTLLSSASAVLALVLGDTTVRPDGHDPSGF